MAHFHMVIVRKRITILTRSQGWGVLCQTRPHRIRDRQGDMVDVGAPEVLLLFMLTYVLRILRVGPNMFAGRVGECECVDQLSPANSGVQQSCDNHIHIHWQPIG